MKTKIFLFILVTVITCFAQVNIINPVKTHLTSFAIVVDKETYDKTKDAILAYRAILRNIRSVKKIH